MEDKEWFRAWFDSPFYHKLYFEHNENKARALVRSLLDFLQPDPGSLLVDIGCGRGRHSRLLAEHGYDVTGTDLSFPSIEYAKQFESEKLHFFQHDMRLPMWINYFDLAFNFYTSFGYFATRREHDNAVGSIMKSLKPGGMVLFDFLNVHYVEEHLVVHEIKEMDNTQFEIYRWMTEDHFFKKILITDPALDHRQEYTEKVAKFSLGDFTDMLSFQKMQVVNVFGDHQLNPYDVVKTPRMMVLARK